MKNIQANKNLIQAETAKAALIKIPHSDFCFWHPKSLIKDGRNSATVTILFFDGVIELKKYGKGKWNSRDVIETEMIETDDLMAKFESIEKSTVAKKSHDDWETKKPVETEPIKSEIKEELKDEENN